MKILYNWPEREMKFIFSQLLTFVVLLLPLFNQELNAQSSDEPPPLLGNERPRLKWRKLETDHSIVIFPQGIESIAQRTARIISALAEKDSTSIGGAAMKVPVILHSQTTFPGGVPTLAPWKSDWTVATPQFSFAGPVQWIDLLTIHEYRHHQQMTMAKRGWFTSVLRATLGQTGWFAYTLMTQPNWFFEGDATYAETMYSNAGRGRTPNFVREYRSLRLSGHHYDYEKAGRNSRKDFVPNIYRQGYYMTSYARRHFGNDIWTKVLEDTYKRKGLFYPFNRSLKKYTGLTTPQLYKATMAELDSVWTESNRGDKQQSTSFLKSPEAKTVTHYRYPHYLPDGKLLMHKSAFDEIPSYVVVDSDGEKKLLQPGTLTPDHEHLSVTGNLLTWVEHRFHPRWLLEDYTVVKTYNFETGKERKITSKSKYLSPSPSYDGKKIVAVEMQPDANHKLVILDTNTGEVLRELSSKPNEYYSYPRWTEDDDKIVVVVLEDKGMALRAFDLASDTHRNLTDFGHHLITRPFSAGEYVYYSASYTGVDNIFALKMNSGEILQLTNSQFGAYDPVVSADRKRFLYSEFKPEGFETREMAIDITSFKEYQPKPEPDFMHADLAEEEGGSILTQLPDTIYQVTRFNPFLKGLINVHSWFPVIDDPFFGIELRSDNIMSNFSLAPGVQYNFNESSWRSSATFTYGALFPILEGGYSYGQRRSDLVFDNSNASYAGRWNESIISGGLRIPFNLSTGNYTTQLSIGGLYKYLNIDFNDNITDDSRDETFSAYRLNFAFSRAQRGARQFLRPRFAQTFKVEIDKTIKTQINSGEQIFTQGSLAFPGLFKTHSFFVTGAYRREELAGAYRFEDRFRYSRGYTNNLFNDSRLDENAFGNIHQISVNYGLPVAFPDLSMGSVAYLRSIGANLFYDFTLGSFAGVDTYMRSAGLEINLDLPLFRIFRPEVTFRFVNRFDIPSSSGDGNFNFEFDFSILDLEF